MRTLLTVAGKRRSATAEDGNGKNGQLLAFLRFPPETHSSVGRFLQRRESRKTPKRCETEFGELKMLRLRPLCPLRSLRFPKVDSLQSDSSTQSLYGLKDAESCEAQTPSNLPARREAASVFNLKRYLIAT